MSFSSNVVSTGSGSSLRFLRYSTIFSVLVISGIFCSRPLRRCAVLISINLYLLGESRHVRDRLLEGLQRRHHFGVLATEMLRNIFLPLVASRTTNGAAGIPRAFVSTLGPAAAMMLGGLGHGGAPRGGYVT